MKTKKKYKFRVFAIFVITGWFLNITVSSQDSLMSYLEIAARNNPGVMQKLNEYQAALQKVPQAGSLSDPQLEVGVFLSPMELIGGNQAADIRLMQMFPWFGVLKNAKDEMSLMAKAKYESFRDAKLQVFYDVQRTWFELFKIKQDIRISEKNVKILQTLERLTLVRYKTIPTGNSSSSLNSPSYSAPQSGTSGSSGMGGMSGGSGSNQPTVSPSTSSMQNGGMGSSGGGSGLSDIYRIQIETGDLNNNIALLKNQLNTVSARFNAYLNRPVNSMVFVPDTLQADTLEISLTSVPDSILENNPMLTMLDYEQQSLESRRKMVSRMSYPMVGLGLNYTLINKSGMSESPMNGKDMIMPMVTVTLPVYRKKYKAMRTEAVLMRSATEQGYRSAANSLQTEYLEALQSFQDAQRRMTLYKSQSQLANSSLDIMISSFSASTAGSNLTDILRIRQQTLDYDLKQVEALVDYNSSVAWLKRLLAKEETGIKE